MLSPGLIDQSSLTGLEMSVARFPGDESPGYYHLVPPGRADRNVKLTLMRNWGPSGTRRHGCQCIWQSHLKFSHELLAGNTIRPHRTLPANENYRRCQSVGPRTDHSVT